MMIRTEGYSFFIIATLIWHSYESLPSEMVLDTFNNFMEVEVKAGTDITIFVTNLTSSVAFGILQANVYSGNVTLSYTSTLSRGFFTTGSNIGLVLFNDGTEKNVAYLKNSNDVPVLVLVGLQVYDSNAPIPGACNMEQSIRTAPFLPTRFTNDIVMVDFPLASWPLNVLPPVCDGAPLQYDFYHLYLPEADPSSRTLFDHIRLMSDWKSIQTHGRKVDYTGFPLSRLKFVNYVGTGRIVSVIVRGLSSSAAYVPTSSYGCIQNSSEHPCDSLVSIVDKLFAAFMLFTGCFMTLMGHRFFKCQVFLVGFCVVSALSYVAIFLIVELPSTYLLLAVIGSGIAGGLMLLGIWASLGVPVLSIFLGCLILGFLFASVVAYSPLADFPLIKDNLTFWLAFTCLALTCPLLFISFPLVASVVFTSIVGSYMLVVPLDEYIGSNLKFIIMNTLRRATDPGFGSAIVDPPFQSADFALVIVWSITGLAGIVFQLRRERGHTRAPFPPPPTWPTWETFRRILPGRVHGGDEIDESTPLLS